MTPEAIAKRLSALREAGAALRQRPARQVLDALARALDAWRDAESPWRGALERELPAATGFSAPMVRDALACGLAPWSGEALHALVASELGSEQALDGAGPLAVTGFDATAVLLAGSIPLPSFVALIAPLALRSPVLAKTAARDPVTAPLLVRSLGEADAELGECAAAIAFPGADAACTEALLDADCVVATGSDETVASVAARVRPGQRLLAHGHRLSLAAVGPDATRGEPLAACAAGLARDVCFWDQLGCLSPVAVYAVDPDPRAADRVAEALAAALGEAQRRWPRGAVETAAAAAIARERDEAEIRAAAGQRVAVHAGDGFVVVREAGGTPRPAPLHRFVRVHPVADAAELLAALRPLAAHLAGVAAAGFGALQAVVSRSLAELGASRVCPPGSLQTPPLAWRRDGCGVLAPLARFTDLEASG